MSHAELKKRLHLVWLAIPGSKLFADSLRTDAQADGEDKRGGDESD